MLLTSADILATYAHAVRRFGVARGMDRIALRRALATARAVVTTLREEHPRSRAVEPVAIFVAFAATPEVFAEYGRLLMPSLLALAQAAKQGLVLEVPAEALEREAIALTFHAERGKPYDLADLFEMVRAGLTTPPPKPPRRQNPARRPVGGRGRARAGAQQGMW